MASWVGVGRDAVIVIAASRQPSINLHGCIAAHGESFDVSIAIEEEGGAVVRPIRGFEASRREIGDTAVGGIDVNRFECAVEHGLTGRGRRLRQFDIRKHRLFDDIFVVRADADAHVERALQRDAQPSTCNFGFAVYRQRHIDVVTPLGDTQSLRSREVRLNFARDGAFLVAELQRGQPAGVQRDIGIHGIGIKTLPQHENSFLMLVAGLGQELDVGGQRSRPQTFSSTQTGMRRPWTTCSRHCR